MADDPHWIEHAHMNKGGLHRALGVPEGDDIPKKRVLKAEHSDNPHLAKRAQAAENMAKLHKRHGGEV